MVKQIFDEYVHCSCTLYNSPDFSNAGSNRNKLYCARVDSKNSLYLPGETCPVTQEISEQGFEAWGVPGDSHRGQGMDLGVQQRPHHNFRHIKRSPPKQGARNHNATTRYKPIQVKWKYVVLIGLFVLCGLIVIVICVCNNKRRSSMRGVQVGVEPYYCVTIYHNNQYQ